MASSNKTSTLELNQWISTDVPKMADFNADNQKIEQAVATHLADSQSHLSQEDREALDGLGQAASPTPMSGSYVGDGDEVHIIQVGFTPTWGMVYAHNKPPCTTVEDGATTQVNFVYLTPGGRSVGCYFYDGKLEVYQETAGHSGYRMNMNQDGLTYYYMFFH